MKCIQQFHCFEGNPIKLGLKLKLVWSDGREHRETFSNDMKRYSMSSY